MAESGNRVFQLVIVDIAVAPRIEVGEADTCRVLKGLELGGFLCLPLLNQPKTLAEDLAGILVAAGLNAIGRIDQRRVSGALGPAGAGDPCPELSPFLLRPALQDWPSRQQLLR